MSVAVKTAVAAPAAGRTRVLRAMRTVATLIVVLVAFTALASAFGVRESTLASALISLVAVLGIGVFSGSSGILSFGHVAFMAIGAYVYGLLTVPSAVKTGALPELPGWLAGASLSPPIAILVTLGVVALAAVPVGLAMMRVSRQSGTIATLAMLLGVNALLLAATDYTRGAQTFYGMTGQVTVIGLTALAIAVIIVAHAFRQSSWGLGLRATRDSEMAAAAVGVDRRTLRLSSWLLSAVIVGAAGIALGVYLKAFSPSSFYLDLTFMLVTMLVVGGASTTSGPLAGVALVTIVVELSRRADAGLSLGPITTPEVFGVPQLALGVVLLIAMALRPSGLVGRRELDELLLSALRRRRERRLTTDEVQA